MLPLFRLVFAFLVSAAWTDLLVAESWQMQYIYDKARSALSIRDLQFPSAQRGVAVGILHERNHLKPVAIVTSDSGAHWQVVPLNETPISLFFLNESMGWMVTTKGLFRTTEAGKNWQALPHIPASILRVYFA